MAEACPRCDDPVEATDPVCRPAEALGTNQDRPLLAAEKVRGRCEARCLARADARHGRAEIHAELGMKRDEQGIMTLPSGWTTREQLTPLHEHVESRAGKVGRLVAPQELVL